MKENDSKNTTGEELSVEKEFELREKRIKIVYKILYVIAAVWGITFWSFISSETQKIVVPVYCYILSVASLYIVNILRYALNEFACMQIYSHPTTFDKNLADISYNNIWKKASLPLLVGAITMMVHLSNANNVTSDSFVSVFTISGIFVCAFVVLKLVLIMCKKSKYAEKIEWLSPISSEIMTYSIFAICCLAVAV